MPVSSLEYSSEIQIDSRLIFPADIHDPSREAVRQSVQER
jgi:hypothetical protein